MLLVSLSGTVYTPRERDNAENKKRGRGEWYPSCSMFYMGPGSGVGELEDSEGGE